MLLVWLVTIFLTNEVRAAIGEFAGFYTGTYSGDDSGPWSVRIDENGIVKGTVYSSEDRRSYGVTGSINAGGAFTAIAGSTTTGATFSGRISTQGGLTGDWRNKRFNERGMFSGRRTELLRTDKRNRRIVYSAIDRTVATFKACGGSWSHEEGKARLTDLNGNTYTGPGFAAVTFRFASPYRLVTGYIESSTGWYIIVDGGPGSVLRYHEFGHVFQFITKQPEPTNEPDLIRWENQAQYYGALLTNHFGRRGDIAVTTAIDYLFRITGVTCRR